MFSRRVMAVVFAVLFSVTSVAYADDIPMTINGEINCANPANAITTSCGRAPVAPPLPPPPPAVDVPHDVPSAPPQDQALVQPMTINGEINCANAANSVTTTCWDRAQTAKANGDAGTGLNGPDCSLPAFADFPVCTGKMSQVVSDFQESQKVAAAGVPVGVDCANPTNVGVGECAGSAAGRAGIDCAAAANADHPSCQPLTINGEINCANSDNAVTTTCWNRALEAKASGVGGTGLNGPDCSLAAFAEFPVCTGVAPQAAVDFIEAQKNVPTVPASAAKVDASKSSSKSNSKVTSSKSKVVVKKTTAKASAPVSSKQVSKTSPSKTIVCVSKKTTVTSTSGSCPSGFKANS